MIPARTPTTSDQEITMPTARPTRLRLPRLFPLLACVGLASAALAAPAQAAPLWQLRSAADTHAAPGATLTYYVQVRNGGPDATSGVDQELAVTLPSGLTGLSAGGEDWSCPDISGLTDFSCTSSSSIASLRWQRLRIRVGVDPATSGVLTTRYELSGGDAPPLTSYDSTRIDAAPPPFGIDAFDGEISADPQGAPFTQAGGHPNAGSTTIDLNRVTHPNIFKGALWPVEPVKDIVFDAPPGLIGNPTALGATCTVFQLANAFGLQELPLCPPASQVGTITLPHYVAIGDQLVASARPLFSMAPPPGVPARFGFQVFGTVVTLDAELRSGSDYGLSIQSINIGQGLPITAIDLIFWGVPGDSSHDFERACPGEVAPPSGPTCTAPANSRPFLRTPTSCVSEATGLETRMRADSWQKPGIFDSAGFVSHDPPGFPAPPAQWGPPQGPTGCEAIPFKPKISLQPTAQSAETPTGLGVEVEVPNPGLDNPAGIAASDMKKAVVTLPEGITINPSAAEALGVCSPAQYAEETLTSSFGEGCPGPAKIGTGAIVTQLLDEPVNGVLYQAQPDDPDTSAPGAENPFDSLLAVYMVAKDFDQGVLVKLEGKVELDGNTGRILTTFDDLPQVPFSKFSLKFREGARAVLTTPPACGTYETEAEFVPWSAKDPDNPTPQEIVHTTSQFAVTSGVGNGPCPSEGVPPFSPGFQAGSINNNAKSFSPFNMRLIRGDGEQDMTKFSAVLPPGVVAKIAGTSRCSEQAIALVKAKSGKEELANPSCPANSQIGRILAGAGVGSVLTYVPGKLYLAGPFAGAPLSVVAITAAVAGPFDVGVIVNRQALTLNPRTGQVNVDGERSDPIPHILEGIPLKVRDVRIYVDRPNFTINPTSCNRFEVGASLWGSFLDPLSPADDVPVGLSVPYQAANCSLLGFKPKLSLKLSGGTKRGGHPGLRAVLRPRPGDANVGAARVTLPSSAFLDQSHIRTICTRVQFAQDRCPPASIYGYARAFTPLLDDPLEGPVYLRSSDNKLPDLVAALSGFVEIELVGKIDSVKDGIRTTFGSVPDAPASKFVLEMQGGKKGLIVNSRNLCKGTNRAKARFTGQNGKVHSFRPALMAQCRGKGRRGRG